MLYYIGACLLKREHVVIYTIVGTPLSIVKYSHAARKVLDSHNMTKFCYQQQLKEQHKDEPFLVGPYEVDVEFYFDKDFIKTRGYVPRKPAISCLLKALDDLIAGIIYENEYILYNVNVNKYYNAPEAKTVLHFRKLKGENVTKNT
jgi:hypothetical protein